MKHENFNKVQSICNQIAKHEEHFNELSQYPNIAIEYPDGARIFKIETSPSREHEYHKEAVHFLDSIKTDLRKRIDNLKFQLESL